MIRLFSYYHDFFAFNAAASLTIATLAAVVVPVFVLFDVTSDVAILLLALVYFLAATIILVALFGKTMFVLFGIEKRLHKLRIHEKKPHHSTSLEDSTNASSLEALATLINEEDKLTFCKRQVLYWQARIIDLDFTAIVGHRMISSRSDSGGSGGKPKGDPMVDATAEDHTSDKNSFDNNAKGKLNAPVESFRVDRASSEWSSALSADRGAINTAYRQANRADDVFVGTKLDLTLYDQNNNLITPTLSHPQF